MTTIQQPETSTTPEKPRVSPLAIFGIITIISFIGYYTFSALAMLQGELTPLYEQDNPYTYSIHQGTRWIMIGILFAATRTYYCETQRQWQSRNETPPGINRQTRKRELLRNVLQACAAIATLPVVYLAFKLISALIQGGTLDETAMPTELESQALNLLTPAALAAALAAYAMDKIVNVYLAIRRAE